MLAARLSASDYLSLVGVELKSVGPHPPAYVTYAVRNTTLELGKVTRLTEAVYLLVVSVEVWGLGRVHEQVEADLRCTEETESVQEPIPVGHRKPAWSRSMMFLYSEQTEIDR